jgi:hypothetical protein
MANGLRVEVSASVFLSERDLPVDDVLFRQAQAVGHCG